ncbi:hypothetical protein [Nocardia amamiensis]|uniref:hypothetical protein n=1 Tax=Nocardia amamiensis TaxID=404578 RepID=UPI000B31B99F|nr:hypothetical protein [Nocardia amamiensis]
MSGVSAVEREAARMLVEFAAPSAEDVAGVVAGEPMRYQSLPEGVRFDVVFPREGGIDL